MTEATDACALWYERWHQTRYDLFDSEQGAADYAVYLTEEGEGQPLGVQFADGRTLKVDDWPAYAARKQRWEENERADAARVVEPRPTRKVRDPFTDAVVDVEVSAPGWLGTGT